MKEEPEIIEINSEEFTENEWLTETDPRVLALTMEDTSYFHLSSVMRNTVQ
ncbi:hypothetical protein ACU9DV_003266 [Escherichia coli]